MNFLDVKKQIESFETILQSKDENIKSLTASLKEAQLKIKELESTRKQYEETVDLKVQAIIEENESEKKEIQRKHQIELETLQKEHKKLDDQTLYERFKIEIKLLRDTFYADYNEELSKKVEKERQLILESLKKEYEEKVQKEKDILLKKFDLDSIKLELNGLKGTISSISANPSNNSNQNNQIIDPNFSKFTFYNDEEQEQEMSKFVQLMQSNGNWQSYRVANSGGVYQVVNAWFQTFKCALPSFCQFWIYEVIREGQYTTCCQNMITYAKRCPYSTWLNLNGDNYSLCTHWLTNVKTIPPKEMIIRTNTNFPTLCQYCIQYAHDKPPEVWRKAYNNDNQLKSWWSSYWPNERNPY